MHQLSIIPNIKLLKGRIIRAPVQIFTLQNDTIAVKYQALHLRGCSRAASLLHIAAWRHPENVHKLLSAR